MPEDSILHSRRCENLKSYILRSSIVFSLHLLLPVYVNLGGRNSRDFASNLKRGHDTYIIHWRCKLYLMLEKYGAKMWAGVIWLRIGRTGMFLWIRAPKIRIFLVRSVFPTAVAMKSPAFWVAWLRSLAGVPLCLILAVAFSNYS
jgi:hypothetical protein